MFCCIRKINIKLGSYLVISGTGTFTPSPSQVISLDVEDAKATYYDTLRMAGKVNIDPKYPVLRRRCDPEIGNVATSIRNILYTELLTY